MDVISLPPLVDIHVKTFILNLPDINVNVEVHCDINLIFFNVHIISCKFGHWKIIA